MAKLEDDWSLKVYLDVGNKMSDDYKKQLTKTIKSNNQIKEGKTDLWRSISHTEFGFKTMGDMLRAISKNPKLITGKTIIPGGFVSTSKTQEGTAGFTGIQMHIQNIDKNVEGTDVSKYASHKNEKEVLFQKGVGYRIDEVELDEDEDRGGVYSIHITKATLVEGNSHSRGTGSTSTGKTKKKE